MPAGRFPDRPRHYRNPCLFGSQSMVSLHGEAGKGGAGTARARPVAVAEHGRDRAHLELFLSENIPAEEYRKFAASGVILARRDGACCYVFPDKGSLGHLQDMNGALRRLNVLMEFMGGAKYPNTVVDQAEFMTLRSKLFQKIGGAAESEQAAGGERKNSSTRIPVFEMYAGKAKAAKASDIQFVRRESDCIIRMRVDGDYEMVDRLSAEEGDAIIAAVMMTCNTDATQFNKSVPQGGSFESKSLGVTLRLNTYPNRSDGVALSARLLGGSHGNAPVTLDGLGYVPAQLRTLRHAISQPAGIIIFSGITGSGKSTSMCAALFEAAGDVEIERITKNILTLEHPIEYPLPVAIQAAIHETMEGRSWADMLRAQLRMDPDILLIGEIRDNEVAHTAVNAAMTGHLVFSTLHATNIPAIFERLVGMGVDRSLLLMPGLFNLLVFQTLVKKVCPNCAMEATSEGAKRVYGSSRMADIDEYFGGAEGIKVHNPEGCAHCHKGHKGQTLLAEVLYVDEIIRAGIRDNNMDDALDRVKNNGWKDRFKVAENKIRAGELCPFHVEDAVGHLTSGNAVYHYRDN